MLSPRSSRPRRPVPRVLHAAHRSPSWGCGSPGRTPGRPARPTRVRPGSAALRTVLMKKFSSSASAWVTSRPNSTSTPISDKYLNNNNKEEDMSTAPPSLPQAFSVKCMGWRESRGLWGVKHTRAPVDAMVAAARSLPAGQALPRATLEVSVDGVAVDGELLPIDCISYGVQDLVYTRVFCCVLVSRPDAPGPPFRCHAFVCESRAAARALTYALATAFQEYSRAVKERQQQQQHVAKPPPPPRTVDLRTPEDIAAEMLSHCQDSEA